MQEAPEQVVKLRDQVISNEAVIAPPSEGGQVPQEVTLHPRERNREAWEQDG